ncbi:chemotaxis protein CheB [bacterium]|nr:chemotaxis protein CheB [bacterium]
MKSQKVKYSILVIGGSAGSFKVIQAFLYKVPIDFPIGIVIVQHRHSESGDFMCDFLNELCELEVISIADKTEFKKSKVYIAPANYHAYLDSTNVFSLSVDDKVMYSRPSIDVLFESVALDYGKKALCVILSGANSDGTLGAKVIRLSGGVIFVQTPRSAESRIMPQSVIDEVEVDKVLDIEDLIDSILDEIRGD